MALLLPTQALLLPGRLTDSTLMRITDLILMRLPDLTSMAHQLRTITCYNNNNNYNNYSYYNYDFLVQPGN